jgi:hypothetical protein
MMENASFYRTWFGSIFHPDTGEFTRMNWPPGADLTTPFVLYNRSDGRTGALCLSNSQHSRFVYDHERDTWISAGHIEGFPLNNSPAVVVLSSDEVLSIGGFYASPEVSKVVYLYNYVTSSVRLLAHMQAARRYHAAVLLPGNRVFVSGGMTYYAGRDWIMDTCEIYDVASDTWRPAAKSLYGLARHRLVFLPSLNLVLALGSVGTNLVGETIYTTWCQFYDVAADRWFAAPPLPGSRTNTSAALM